MASDAAAGKIFSRYVYVMRHCVVACVFIERQRAGYELDSELHANQMPEGWFLVLL